MPKRNPKADLRNFLVILVILLLVMTPFGKHALIGASNWMGKKVANSITSSIPKTPTVTPSTTSKLTK